MLKEKPELNKEPNIVISVRIVNDSQIKELNKKYRSKDTVTDVLSFDSNDKLEDTYILGDIVVNKEQAARQAKEYSNTTEEEIAELIAHGALHLLGVHHDEDAH